MDSLVLAYPEDTSTPPSDKDNLEAVMAKRSQIKKHVAAKVMMASRRRCCLCVYLNDRHEIRQGQIAHLNRNSHNSLFDNLVFLCLDHHDLYDSRPSQSKGFSEIEVKVWRDRLYAKYDMLNRSEELNNDTQELAPLPSISQYTRLIKKGGKRFGYLTRPWRYPLSQVANQPELFAYKSRNNIDGVCLIERIDIPDGRIVVVCIQIAGNPGKSITNSVEELCLQVCDRFDIPAAHMVWLEHYDQFPPDEWNIVKFTAKPPEGDFSDPTWTTMTPEMWKDLRMKPKKRMRVWAGQYESKVAKLFRWPFGVILD